jgi:F420H(2)-dependent quinone reductase
MVDRVRRPALRGTLLGTVLRLFNPLVKTVLRSRLHWLLSRWLVLLTWTSRKTGRRRTTPLSYVREGSVVYLSTAERWSVDLVGGAPVRLRLGGRWYDGHAGVVEDRKESVRLLARLFREHPWFRILSGVPKARSSRGADPGALNRTLDAGRVLVRVSRQTGRAL